MKSLIYLILPIFALICSCDKNDDVFPDNCHGYSAGIYKHGYAFAEGSYQDFGDYAIFIRERVADTINGGWTHDPIEKSILLTNVNDVCAEKMQIGIKNIRIALHDTILLFYSRLGTGVNNPTSDLDFRDVDATIEQYDLIENSNCWVIIENVNSDTTEIEGRFHLSFVTTYEPYLTGEKERWDDPNRPDTLHFTNGEFRAVFADF